MFRTNRSKRARPQPLSGGGGVSSGTLRPQDLLPTFLAFLRAHHPDAAAELDGWLGWTDTDFPPDGHAWWGSAECQQAIEFAWAALCELAPDGYYFGASEGDASDIGFWSINGDGLPDQTGMYSAPATAKANYEEFHGPDGPTPSCADVLAAAEVLLRDAYTLLAEEGISITPISRDSDRFFNNRGVQI